MKAHLLTAVVVSTFSAWGLSYAEDNMMSLIPHAKPGECYARVMIPPKFRTETSTVVIKEASQSLHITPATYDWVEEQVVVSEATSKLEVVPATYGTETDTIEISPSSTQWVTGSKYSTIEASPGLLALAAAGGADLSSASAGQCFQEYYEAPKFNEVTERVLVSEASETIKVIPARYEWVEKQQIVAAATQKMVEIPAVFDTVTERIKVEDAKVVWKKGRGIIEKIDNVTGDIMCLVEVPAVYKTVEKTVMKSAPTSRMISEPVKYDTVRVRKLIEPAQEVRTEVPAKYREITTLQKTTDARHFWSTPDDVALAADMRKTGNLVCKREIPAKTMTVSRTVVRTPAIVNKVEIPARYQTKRVRKLATAATESRIDVPAITRQVEKRVKIHDSRLEWVPVLCETNTTTATIKRLQNALIRSGYELGDVSGVLNQPTMKAVENYQREHGLGTGGLTIELLNKLGVNPG